MKAGLSVSDALSAIGIVDLEDLREFDGNLRAEFDFIKKTYFKSILVNVILSFSNLRYFLLIKTIFVASRQRRRCRNLPKRERFL
jgi:hypothetical protein